MLTNEIKSEVGFWKGLFQPVGKPKGWLGRKIPFVDPKKPKGSAILTGGRQRRELG